MHKTQLKHIVPLLAALLSLSCAAADSIKASAESPLYEPLVAEAALPRSAEGGRVKSARLLPPSPLGEGSGFPNGVEASLGGTAKHPLALLSTKNPFYEPRSTVVLELSYEKGPSRSVSILIEPRPPAYYFAPPSLRPSLGLLAAAPLPTALPAPLAPTPLPAIPTLSPPAAPAPPAAASVANSRFIWAPWVGLAGVSALAFIGARALRRRRLADSAARANAGFSEAPEIDGPGENMSDAGDFESAGSPSFDAEAPPPEAHELDKFDLGPIGSQSGIQMELALLYAKMGDEDSARDIISDIMASNEFADARPSALRLLSILDK